MISNLPAGNVGEAGAGANVGHFASEGGASAQPAQPAEPEPPLNRRTEGTQFAGGVQLQSC
jgi:hypothetical protein